MKFIKTVFLKFSLGIIVLFLSFIYTAPILSARSLAPLTTVAATCTLKNEGFRVSQEIFVPWYKYLPGDDSSGKCSVTFDLDGDGSTENEEVIGGVVRIGVAVLELLTRLSALIAAGFFIFGSIQYVTSQGDPNGLNNAKSTISNALIGLIIVVIAIGLVQFVGNSLR